MKYLMVITISDHNLEKVLNDYEDEVEMLKKHLEGLNIFTETLALHET